MGNRFSGGGSHLRLGNGATDAFQSLLQFALSDLAGEPWERALAQWFAWHDQNLVGSGTVGFDLADRRIVRAAPGGRAVQGVPVARPGGR
ncbi:hypothetical protein AB0H57_04605 [Micromonospora sp. NPDC050686]|uniref:hypothetical protein n=1 Tax=Micromonospora sp. NPDC050686 TaxID=3154631 RepID=UPI0033F0EA11